MNKRYDANSDFAGDSTKIARIPTHRDNHISVARNLNFRRQFLEMAFISLGVAGISFLIGFALRILLSVDV